MLRDHCPRRWTRGLGAGLLAALCCLGTTAAQQPDLQVATIDATGVTGDWQTLVIAGSVDVDVEYTGGAASGGPFDVLAFEDRNGNGAYDPGTDLALGSTSVAGVGAGATVTVTVGVSGTVTFPGRT